MAKIHRTLWFRFLLLALLSSMAWAQLPVTDDSYVTSTNPTTNSGNNPSLVVQQSTNGTTLIKLDISPLTAAGVTSGAIDKAYLKLYTSAVTSQGTFDLYKVTSSWAEGTVTYNTMPSMSLVTAGTTCPSGVQCVNTASKYVQVDITSLLQGWMTTPASNFGLALKPNSTTISVTFESKESTTTSHAPELDVVYNNTLAQIPGQIGPSQVAPGTYGINISGSAGTLAATSQCLAGAYATGISVSGTAQCSTNGSALTGLNASQLTIGTVPASALSGTYGINVSGTASNVTGTIGTLNGGTGLSLPSIASGSYLRGTGSGFSVSPILIGDLPSLYSLYVDLTSTQTVGGNKTFTGTLTLTNPFLNGATINQAANNTDALFGKRATDTSPTGNLIHFKNAASSADLFTVDVTGTLIAGTVPGSHVTGNISGNAVSITGTINGSQVTGNISGNAASITGSISESQVTNLTTDLSNETSARQAADTAEASTRAATDVALSATIANETSRAQTAEGTLTTNLNNEISRAQTAEATKADLTKPVQIDTTALTNGSCAAVNALVLNPGQPSGRQLFVCRDTGGNILKWQLINDDSATTTAANAYTDQQVAAEAAARTAADNAEATARQAADTTLQGNINAETSRAQGAESTLQSNINAEAAARMAADAAEAATRAAGDTTLQNNINAETGRAQTAEAAKADLTGNNTFTGINSFTGSKVDLSAAGATLPVQTIMGLPPTGNNVCLAGQMVLQKDGAVGQQLFICNATFDGWVAVNDDTALTGTLQAVIAAEAAARQAADQAEATARQQGDANTLASANGYTDTAVNNEAAARQAADATLQTNINNESAARQAMDALEAAARVAGDAATLASANTYTDAAKTNILTQPQTFAGNETFSGDNGFSGINTFTNKVDLSAAKTLPVQTTMATPPASGSPNACVAGQMLLQINGTPGQQLFICNVALDGWVMVNDDTATTSAANAYTDAKVLAEQNRATAAEGAITANLNFEIGRATSAEAAETARATTAETALGVFIANESARAISAEAGLSSAITTETARATAAENTKANLAGGNTFTGNQIVNGNTTLNGSLALPATTSGSGAAPSQTFQLAGSDAGNQPTLFEWLVTTGGVLDLRTATGGNPTQDSGLMIGSDGKITFVTGQTFPGVQSTLTAGTGISIVGSTINNTGSTTVDGTTILNSGTALNPNLSVGTIAQGQVTNLTSDLAAANASISSETTRAQGAESALSVSIASEAGRATTAESALSGSISGEASRAQTAEAGKANLFGNNNFSGNQSITGNLSVTGTDTVNGTLSLPATGTATSGNPFNSNALDLIASSFSGSAINETFRWQAEGNGSSNVGSLNLLFASGANTPVETGLSIDSTGKITFASGQTFPGTNNGTVTSIATNGPITGGPITTSGTISCPTCVTSVTASAPLTSSVGTTPNISLTGIVPVVNGGTGTASTSQNFVFAGPTSGPGAPSFRSLVAADLPSGAFVQLNPSSQQSGTISVAGGSGQTTVTVGASGSGTGINVTAAGTTGTGVNSQGLTGIVGISGASNNQLALGVLGQCAQAGCGGAKGLVSDPTSVALIADNTAGSGKVFSIRNNGAEKSFFDIGGNFTTAGGVTSTAGIFTGNGSGLTNINAATLGGLSSSAFAQLGTNNVFTGSITGSSFSGNGANLAALNATNISTGTLADARLSTNVPLLNAANSFTNTTGNTFAGTTTLGNTGAGSGGLLLPVSHNGSSNPSFPLDMEATNTGGIVHLFRIIGQDGTTPNWTFQFCNSAPCAPTSNGVSIAGLTGALTAPSITDSGLTSGNCVQASTNGLLTTTGAPCASGSGNVSGTGLTANQLIIGGGSSSISTLGAAGTTTTVLHGNAGGAPSFGAVSLTTDVTNVLPVANGGTGSNTLNFVDLTTTQTVGGNKTFSGTDAVSGSLAPSGTGTISATKLQTTSVATTAPTSGQVLAFNGTNWTPTTITSGGFTSVTTVTGTGTTFAGNAAVGATVTSTATCSTGTMVGGGANITGNSASNAIAAVTTSFPSAANTWTATATELIHASNGQPPTVTAYALCAQ